MDATSREIYLRLLRHVLPHWRMFAGGIAAMVLLAATEPAIPALMKPTLDGSFVEKDLESLAVMSVLLVALFAVRGFASYLSAVCLGSVAAQLVMDLRARMFDRLTRMPARLYDRAVSGNLISKVTFDASQVTDAATHVATVLVRDSLAILGLLAWMLYLDWRLTLIVFLVAPVVLVVVKYFGRRLRRMSRDIQEGMGDITRVLEEAIGGYKVVRIFDARRYETARFRGRIDHVRRSQVRFLAASAANAPIAQLLTAIGLAVILYIAGHQSAEGETTVGSFVSFFMAMAMLFAPLKRLTGVNGRLQQGLAAAESVFRLVDEPQEEDTGTRTLERARGRLELSSVSFAYELETGDVLHDVDLVIEPGETMAIVGPSGAGKSTLISLLPRFYEATRGTITLDGIDIRELTLDSLRSNIAMVTQEVMLFNDTVAANIAYGKADHVARTAIEEAATAAHAMEFVARLPHGLDTLVGEKGVRLSAGQRQRLAIARAFLKNAPVLILDEATSSLDNESERQVQAALEELRRGRTTIIIAHRLSTVETADRIAVLEGGRLVGLDTHARLLETNRLYASLYRFQFSRQEPPAARTEAH